MPQRHTTTRRSSGRGLTTQPLCRRCRREPIEYHEKGLGKNCHAADMREARRQQLKEEWARRLPLLLNDAMSLVRGKRQVTSAVFREKLELSEQRTRQLTRALVERGVLVRAGRGFKVLSMGVEQPATGEVIVRARQTILETRRTEPEFLQHSLGVAGEVVLSVLAHLEGEGILGQPDETGLRPILVGAHPQTAAADPAPDRTHASSDKERRLAELAAALGAGETANFLRSLIADLRELDQLRDRWRRLNDVLDDGRPRT